MYVIYVCMILRDVVMCQMFRALSGILPIPPFLLVPTINLFIKYKPFKGKTIHNINTLQHSS